MNGVKPEKEAIVEFMNWYKSEHGNYPTSYEFDACTTKPCSVKTIERNYGGYVQLKKELGVENPDARTGEVRSIRAQATSLASLISENEFYFYLIEKFEKINVHRWEPYVQGIQRRSDYGVYNRRRKHIFIDIFWASNLHTAMACINFKLNKIPEGVKSQIYFVCTNENIDKENLYRKVKTKKNKLAKNMEVFEINDFKSKILAGDIL